MSKCTSCGQEMAKPKPLWEALGNHYAAEKDKPPEKGPARTPGEAPKSIADAAAGQRTWYEQRAREHWARMGEQGA